MNIMNINIMHNPFIDNYFDTEDKNASQFLLDLVR